MGRNVFHQLFWTRFYYVSSIVSSASENLHIPFTSHISSVDITVPISQMGQKRLKEPQSQNQWPSEERFCPTLQSTMFTFDSKSLTWKFSLYPCTELLPWAQIYFGCCGETDKQVKVGKNLHDIERSANENDLNKYRYIFCNILLPQHVLFLSRESN